MQAEIKMKTADSISWFDFQIYKKIKESLSTSPHLKKKTPNRKKVPSNQNYIYRGSSQSKIFNNAMA